jgi:pimeloyl-ACP methyl ester carboxylesterase
MLTRISLISLVFFMVSQCALAASKSDLAKEKRWEEQIVPSLLVGEAVKLKADGTEFLGLYAENTTDKAIGGLIILHGIGVHPAWPDIIDPLRMQLPDHGWHTLSLQMPILPNEAGDKEYPPLFDEVPARIQAGVAFLKAKGINNIVIAAHSLGVTMAHYYLAGKPDAAVKAFVCISGGPGYPADPRMDSLANFKKLKLPYYDIYGSQDLDGVLATAPKRAAYAKQAGLKNYSQKEVQGANHFYTGMQDDLVKLVRGWLEKHAKGTQTNK